MRPAALARPALARTVPQKTAEYFEAMRAVLRKVRPGWTSWNVCAYYVFRHDAMRGDGTERAGSQAEQYHFNGIPSRTILDL